jgi:hypothetical protein
VSELKHLLGVNFFSSVFMTGGHDRGWHEHVLNERVPYHERSVQNVIVEDLQRQVAELTQRLAGQNMEKNCNINGHNSESNFENPILRTHITTLFFFKNSMVGINNMET